MTAAPRPTPGTTQPWHRAQLANALEPQAEAEPGASRSGWGMLAPPVGTLTAPRTPEAISLPLPALPAVAAPTEPSSSSSAPGLVPPAKQCFPQGSAVSQRGPSGRRNPWKLPLPPLAGEGPGWGLRRAPALVRQGQHCDTATAGLRRISERLWGDETTALRDGISKLH